MKRILSLLLALITALSLLTSCAGTNQKGERYEPDPAFLADIETKSINFALEFAKGNFDSPAELYSESFKLSENSAKISENFALALTDAGNYLNYNGFSTSTSGTYTFVKVVLEYAVCGICVQFNYNSEGLIEGIWVDKCDLMYASQLIDNEVFTEYEVTLGSKNPVKGILAIPKNAEDPACAILVHGSGENDMNMTNGAAYNKPFRDIAHDLAAKGIASIRYNKRYYEYPYLQTNASTPYDEIVEDAFAAIEYAKTDARINAEKIFLFGHSLGGMLAPKIAYESEQIAGLIIAAGSPRDLEDIIYDQRMYSLDANDTFTQSKKDDLISVYLAEYNKIKELDDEYTAPLLGKYPDYWRYLKEANGGEYALLLKNTPMFIIHPEDDFQVYVQDFNLWKDLLGNIKNVSFKLYSGLNHMFMKSNGYFLDMTEYDTPDTVNSEVTSDIAQFILSH